MATDIFLKIDEIKGESRDSKHKDEIEVLSWQWGMKQSSTMHSGSGGGAGKVSVRDLLITKYVDCASPNLAVFCSIGKHFSEAVLVARKAGGNPLEYYRLTIKDVIISEVSVGGSGGLDRISETVALSFSEYKIDYVPQKADGSGSAAITQGFSVTKNARL